MQQNILLATATAAAEGITIRDCINDDKDCKYEGEIENGLAHGQGTNISPDGDIYVGKFKDGEYHGQGTFTFHDGAKYVGEFKDGKVWNGKIYNGNFTYKIVNGE